jgi:hypothetical protein
MDTGTDSDADLNPVIIISYLQDVNKKIIYFFYVLCSILFEGGTFTSCFKDKNS